MKNLQNCTPSTQSKTLEELEEGDIVEVMYNELLIYAIKKGDNHFEDIVYIGEEGNAVPSTQTFKLEKNYTYVRFIQSTISPLSIVKGLLPEYFI